MQRSKIKLAHKPRRKDIFPYTLPASLDTRCGVHAGTSRGRHGHRKQGTSCCQACRRYSRENKHYEENKKRIKAGLPSYEIPNYFPHDLTVAQYEWLKYHSKKTAACKEMKATRAGYQRHRRAGEEICVDCYLCHKRKQAINHKKRKINPVRCYTPLRDWQGVICHAPTTQLPGGARGTYAGVRRHLIYKTPMCDDCVKVENEYYQHRLKLNQKSKHNKILYKYS